MVYILLYKWHKFLLQIFTFFKVKLLTVHWGQPRWCPWLVILIVIKYVRVSSCYLVTGLRSSGYLCSRLWHPLQHDVKIDWLSTCWLSPCTAVMTKPRSARRTPQDKFAYWFLLSLSLFDCIWGLLWSLRSISLFRERKPEIFHKFVFRMNFTVESLSIAEYAYQRGNKTFFQ